MAINWPPVPNPWPPPEIGMFQASDIRALVSALQADGFTLDPPTAQERNLYFRDARDDEGHTVLGRMVVSPSGARYPFAVCTEPAHRALLVLWPPYEMGWDSGREE